MKKISLYLDEAIESGVAKNSSDLARLLGISRSALSEWRADRSSPNDDQAVKLAELLGKDPGELLAECGAARAKTPETRRAWERIAARMAASAAVVAVLVALGAPDEVYANVITGPDVTVFRSVKHLSEAPLSLPDFTRSKSCVSWPGIGVQPLPAMK